MNLIFLGPPGAGKGSYASRVSTLTGLKHISVGDIFREEIKKKTKLGKKVAAYVKKGELIPDSLTIKTITKKLKRGRFILDGFPRTIKQAEALEKEKIKIDAAINFEVSPAAIIERLSGRMICPRCKIIYHIKNIPPRIPGKCDKCGSKLYQREDEKPEIIKKRLVVYKRQTQPLIDFYKKRKLLININGDRKVDVVVKELIDIIKNLK